MWLNMAMNKVKVGELRNHLSKYLKKLRSGVEFTIQDRDTPIARLVPFKEWTAPVKKLEMIPPKNGFEGFSKFIGPDVECPVDPVEYLLEDRRKR